MLLENDQFLTELGRMFQRGRNSGSVWITMKRWDGKTKPTPKPRKNVKSPPPPPAAPMPAPHEFKCLFRAVLGAKKISTIVNQKDVNKFQLAYANVVKINVDNLKKREKATKTNASSATGAASATKKSKVEN